MLSLEAKTIERRMAAERPRNELASEEFCKVEVDAVPVILRAERLAPAILNLGQVIKAKTTPMKASVWFE